jgi:hypothetical protein
MQVSAQVAPVKIMVVGDSISQGHSGDYTWRYRLWEHLTSDSVSFDLVGPKSVVQDDNNPNGTHDYLVPGFDQDHDATWGRPVYYEKDTIISEMQASQPDILLVNLGTNDLAWGFSDPAGTAQSMATFIANARSVNPNIKIVLSLLTPRSLNSTDPWITGSADYNNRLQTLAAQTTTAQSPVVIADPRPGFDPAIDTYDGTHPAPNGEYKIAAAFVNALSSNFGIGTAYGPIPQAPSWPQAPTGLNATPGDGQATITWSAVMGASSYAIHMRNVTRGESFTKLQNPVSGTSFTGMYLTNGETYEFAVSTIRGNIAGPMSAPVQVLPDAPLLPAPAGLTAKPSNGQVKLDWNPVGNAWYYVYTRNASLGESFVRLYYPASTTTFTATMLTNGHTYEFKVTTINGAGKEGPATTPVSATPNALAQAPTGLTATAGAVNSKKVTLNWNAVANTNSYTVTGYQIWIKDTNVSGATFSKWSTKKTATTVDVTGLIKGHTYQFKVTTVNLNDVEGPFSATVSKKAP